MEILWDEPKRQNTLKTRGMDFANVTEEFFEAALIVQAKNNRFMAIGIIDDEPISVVFLPLGTEAISIISMRHASRKERNAYAQAF
ncbi:BrnT family toxin [Beijerinckia indica]|uniref:BrnT family toxin n=1 Tax=Beijerinckia indica subsp. indica (strain ATCC 9039 / DSM 1715 / NCIMB 8712) TaxID=395963 RepID=B2ICD9_BEII9|nr:BrnT family toxin [Beijerinckia indica]ACB96736.1 conserved hypothetical protein [Beijerinckia indica subsp. indica ATCC 9039]